MPSAVIRRYDYDPQTARLEILFQTGRRYVYREVPPGTYEAMRRAFSKGWYFNRHIRDRYPCERLA